MIVKSFARIHEANLVNFGILPLMFSNVEDYEEIDQGDRLELETSELSGRLELVNHSKGVRIPVRHNLVGRDLDILKVGGKLPYIKSRRQ